MNQRWLHRAEKWSDPSTRINPALYDVAEITFSAARTFVETHHYSGSYVADRKRYGLLRSGQLVGVAVFSQPISNAALTNVFGDAPACELGRFVLLDGEPGNSESWFLARCFELARKEFAGILSFSDPTARTDSLGRTVHFGHLGVIYQATNAAYLGRATARTLRLLPDGTILNARTLQKIRSGERGASAGISQLMAHGAPAPGSDPVTWLNTWLPKITRPLKHAGNHRYAWAFSRTLNKQLRDKAQTYPKRTM